MMNLNQFKELGVDKEGVVKNLANNTRRIALGTICRTYNCSTELAEYLLARAVCCNCVMEEVLEQISYLDAECKIFEIEDDEA